MRGEREQKREGEKVHEREREKRGKMETKAQMIVTKEQEREKGRSGSDTSSCREIPGNIFTIVIPLYFHDYFCLRFRRIRSNITELIGFSSFKILC